MAIGVASGLAIEGLFKVDELSHTKVEPIGPVGEPPIILEVLAQTDVSFPASIVGIEFIVSISVSFPLQPRLSVHVKI